MPVSIGMVAAGRIVVVVELGGVDVDVGSVVVGAGVAGITVSVVGATVLLDEHPAAPATISTAASIGRMQRVDAG